MLTTLQTRFSKVPRELALFITASFAVGMAGSLVDSTLNNFLNDSFTLTGFQRSFLEIPREFPGMITVLISALFCFLGSRRLGGFAQLLAAAGIFALEKMTHRLKEDQEKASRLAEGLAKIPGIVFEMGMPQTNMVFPSISVDLQLTTRDVVLKMGELGVKLGAVANRRFRLVTHYWITDEDINYVIKAFEKVVAG